MRVLVTGGAGYIGSHTVVELMGRGHDVCIYDNFHNSSPIVLDRIRSLTNGALELVEGDIRDRDVLQDAFASARPDAVIHFAGRKAVGESEANPLDYYDTNVGGTLNLLRVMQDLGCGKLIFSSSATVYGEPEYLPYDEDHPCAPTNVYGRTKLLAENLITDWARDGRSAALLRYFNPVGAHASGMIGEDPSGEPGNLVPYVAQVAIGRREAVAVFGEDYETADGTGERDYIHVTDLARAHVASLDWLADAEGARRFNIGTGHAASVREVIAAFSRAVGADIPTKIAPRRAGDIAQMRADPSRAERELGWKAERDLNDMVASAWAWQSANPLGYASEPD